MIWFVALGQERLGTPFSLESWLSTASFPGLAISLRGRNACRAADMTMVQHVWVAGMDPSPARLVGRGKVTHGWSSEAVSKLSGSRAISIQPLPDAASDAGRLSVPAGLWLQLCSGSHGGLSEPTWGGARHGVWAVPNPNFPAAGGRGAAGLDLTAAWGTNRSQGGLVLPPGVEHQTGRTETTPERWV